MPTDVWVVITPGRYGDPPEAYRVYFSENEAWRVVSNESPESTVSKSQIYKNRIEIDGVMVSTKPPHGSDLRYTYYSCRCNECKNARNIAQKDRAKRTQAKRIMKDGRWFHPTANHGTRSAYNYHGCRCDKCRENDGLILPWTNQKRH